MEHLATQGYEWLPETLTLPGQLPCDEWDEALKPQMTPEVSDYDFLSRAIYGAWTAILGLYLLVARTLHLKAKVDGHDKSIEAMDERLDKSIEVLDARLETEHLENKAAMAQMQVNLLTGQDRLGESFAAVRRTLDDVLLQRGRGADVDRSYQKRKNGDE